MDFTTANVFDLLSDKPDSNESKSSTPARATASKPALSPGSAYSHKGNSTAATKADFTSSSNTHYVYEPHRPAICARCGDIGHLITACKADYCSTCGKYGHQAGSCARACQTCGRIHKQTQHQHEEKAVPCPLRRCYECCLYGHRAHQCPKVKCRRCGLCGHYAKSCGYPAGNSSNASKTDHSSNSTRRPPVANSSELPAETAAADEGVDKPQDMKLLRNHDALQEQQQQQRQRLIASVRASAPEYVNQLQQNETKLDALSSLNAADLAAILQQRNCAALLDKVYCLYQQNRACKIPPSQLEVAAAARFRTAVQRALPGLLLPVDWSSSSSWQSVDEVVLGYSGGPEVEGKRKLLSRLKLRAQMATYLGGTQATQQPLCEASDNGKSVAAGHKAPVVRVVRRPPWPQRQQNCSPQLLHPADMQQDEQQDHHKQQQLDSTSSSTGPSSVSETPQQQHQQQVTGVKASNGGHAPVHPITEPAAAPSTENSLPLLVSILCDNMRSMLQMVASKEVQLTQPFLDQLLLAAEAANEADHLCKRQQKLHLQQLMQSVKKQQGAFEPASGQQGDWEKGSIHDWDAEATRQHEGMCEASRAVEATATLTVKVSESCELRAAEGVSPCLSQVATVGSSRSSVTGTIVDFENAVAALSAAAAAAVPDDVGGEDDELLGLLLSTSDNTLC